MKNTWGTERLIALFKCLMAAYLITGALLLAVAGLLYKFSLGENVVDISIIVIYCISSLLAGLFSRKERQAGGLYGAWQRGRHILQLFVQCQFLRIRYLRQSAIPALQHF